MGAWKKPEAPSTFAAQAAEACQPGILVPSFMGIRYHFGMELRIDNAERIVVNCTISAKAARRGAKRMTKIGGPGRDWRVRFARSPQKNRVEYIVVGGAAALAHGSARFTQNLDVVYSRSPENLERLVSALRDLRPYLRGAPPGLPFVWDRVTLARGLNFTLETSLGQIDLLGEIPGGGTYADPCELLCRVTALCRYQQMPQSEAVDPGQTRGGAPQGSGSSGGTGSAPRRSFKRLTAGFSMG